VTLKEYFWGKPGISGLLAEQVLWQARGKGELLFKRGFASFEPRLVCGIADDGLVKAARRAAGWEKIKRNRK
jgi:hypothetical protein